MLRKILFVALMTAPHLVHAEFISGSTISKLYGSTSIKFGVDNAPSDTTCNYYGRHFYIDATNDGGKNMLSILLAAHLSGKKVDIWYRASTAPGTDETDGCTDSTIATITNIGFSE